MTESIRSVINSSFIELFNSSKSSGSTLSLSTSSSTQSSSDRVDFSTTLQSGASVYSKAIQTISSGAGYVNLAIDTLTQLGEITDELITLADKATRSSGPSSLRRLNIAFQKLGDKFNKLIKDAKFDEREYLTKDGLETLFCDIGLDPDKARDLANIFDSFILAEKDPKGTLASEMTQPKSPAPIPKSAFVTKINQAYYGTLEQESHVESPEKNIQGFTTTVNAITASVADSEDPDSDISITVKSLSNGSQITHTYGAETNTTIKAVNQNTGYFIIQSNADLIEDQNPDEYSNLFLCDEKGNVIHQITDFSSSAVRFGEVALGDDNTVLYTYSSGVYSYLVQNNFETPGDSPEDSDETVLDRVRLRDPNAAFRDVSISNDGCYFAYLKYFGGNMQANLMDSETLETAEFLLDAEDVESIGFIDNNTVAFLHGTDDDKSISTYTYDDTSFTTLATNVSGDSISTIQKQDEAAGCVSYASTSDSGVSTIHVIQDNGLEIYKYKLGNHDSLDTFNLSRSSEGNIEIGILGTLAAKGDSDSELYKLSLDGGIKEKRYSTRVTRPLKLFSSSFAINSRAAGYVALDDLKAIKKQIDENLKLLDNTLDLMQKNVDLARATGYAMLNISYSITDSDTAESVAGKVRREIQKTAPNLLGQIHNLEPLACAALLYDKK